MRARQWLIIMVSLATAVKVNAFAAETHPGFGVAPAPDWVLSSDIGTADTASYSQIRGGNYTLLFDTQVDVADDRYTFYRRHASLVVTEAGLQENGQFTLSFDPSSERVDLHHLNVHRDGKVIDRIGDVTFQIAREEKDLENGVSDGYLTVFAEIPDVRVGDVVDWAATWHVTDENWPGHLYYDFNTQWSVPSAHDRTIIYADADRPLTIKPRNDAPAPQIEEADGRIGYRWEQENVKPVPHFADLPSDVFGYAAVSISTLSSWEDIANWGAEVYHADLTLPETLATQAAEMASRPDAEKITWAIRYVQDEIRYFSNAEGLGSHIPRTPAFTVAQGYGDCKDKSVLLVALLKALGVEADVALADLDEGLALPMRAPSPYVFNHAVVRIKTKNGPVYIDPTRQLQGGTFPHIRQAELGFALPLIAGATLEAMPLASLDRPTLAAEEVFDFGDLDNGVTLDVITIRRGIEGDRLRNYLAATPVSSLADQFYQYYRQYYPGLERRDDLSITDHRDAGEMVITEKYFLPAEALSAELLAAFPLDAEGVRLAFPQSIMPGRPLPVAIGHPNHVTHTLVLKGVHEGVAPGPARTAIVGPLELSFKAERDAAALTTHHTIRTRADRLMPEDFAQYRTSYGDFLNSLDLTLDLRETQAAEGQASGRLGNAPLVYGGSLLVALVIGAGFGRVAARRPRASAQ